MTSAAILDVVEEWAVLLCDPALDAMADAAAALGLPEPFERRATVALFRPQRAGVAEVQLTVRGGVLSVVDLKLDSARPTLADLEGRFGSGQDMPHAPESSTSTLSFRVAPPDRPYECSIFVRFPRRPTPDAEIASVSLRRDRVR